MSDVIAVPRPGKLLYGAKAIANYLGVPRRVVYHLMETGHLPHRKIGRTVCATLSSIDAALQRIDRQAG
jgi:excisionase family DNA binding protein